MAAMREVDFQNGLICDFKSAKSTRKCVIGMGSSSRFSFIGLYHVGTSAQKWQHTMLKVFNSGMKSRSINSAIVRALLSGKEKSFWHAWWQMKSKVYSAFYRAFAADEDKAFSSSLKKSYTAEKSELLWHWLVWLSCLWLEKIPLFEHLDLGCKNYPTRFPHRRNSRSPRCLQWIVGTSPTFGKGTHAFVWSWENSDHHARCATADTFCGECERLNANSDAKMWTLETRTGMRTSVFWVHVHIQLSSQSQCHGWVENWVARHLWSFRVVWMNFKLKQEVSWHLIVQGTWPILRRTKNENNAWELSLRTSGRLFHLDVVVFLLENSAWEIRQIKRMWRMPVPKCLDPS